MSAWTAFRDLITFREPLHTLSTEERTVSTSVTPWLAGRAQWPERTISTYDNEGYRKLGLIFSAVTMTAESFASGTVRVYDEAADNESIPAHPLRQLMRRPNPEMEESRWLSMMMMMAAVAGFSVAEKERSASGKTVALWPLRSDWLRPILRDQAPPDWEYRIPGMVTPHVFEAKDVLHYTYADRPDMSPFGLGPLELCLREVGLLNRMTDFIKQFFDGGAVPFYGLIPDLQPGQTMNQEQVDRLTDSWMRKHAGMDKATRPAVLQSIKDVKRLSLDMNELAYTELRDLSDLAIAQAFRIPASMLQIRVGLEHSDSRANAEVDEGKFYRQTINPLWRRFDGMLSLNLLPEVESRQTVSLEFDTSKIEALQDNRNEKAVWLVDGAKSGVFSIQTVHRELGLPIPDGEDFYLRGMATEAVPVSDPMGETIITQLPPAQPKALPATTTPPIRAIPEDFGDALDTVRAMEAAGKYVPIVPGRYGMRYASKIRAVLGPTEYRRATATVNRKLIGRIAEHHAPGLRSFFAAQGRRIVPKITGQIAARSTVSMNGNGSKPTEYRDDVADLIDWPSEDDLLRQELTKTYVTAGQTAFGAIEDTFGINIGINFDLANPRILDVVNTLADREEGPKGINATTRQQVSETVTRGLNEGKSISEIANDLNGVFDDPARSLTVARTESMVAYGEANVLGFKESGVVDRAQIFDNPDHTDDYGSSDGLTCASRDGTVWPIDEAMDHIYADHPNGSAVMAPVTVGEVVE